MGHPVDIFLSPPSDGCICAICLDVLKDAVSIKECGHSFCNDCAASLLARKECSTCRVEATGVNPNFSVRDMIGSMQVKCFNQDEDVNKRARGNNGEVLAAVPEACTWTGPFDDLKVHNDDCQFKVATCPVEGCGHKCCQRDMNNHLTSGDGFIRHMDLMKSTTDKKIMDMEKSHKEMVASYEQKIDDMRRRMDEKIADIKTNHHQTLHAFTEVEKKRVNDMQRRMDEKFASIQTIQGEQNMQIDAKHRCIDNKIAIMKKVHAQKINTMQKEMTATKKKIESLEKEDAVVGAVNDRFPREHTFIEQTSTRQTSRRSSIKESVDDEDENEFIEELVSTHTKPSGQYAQDWLTADHFFKMPRGSNVNRKWLSRTNSQCSYIGTKAYCPQVGDSVVYIPRAHYDTLQVFPTGEFTAPWKSWPTTQPWPVVRCKVTHVRYRFPYEMYYASGRRTTDGLKDVAAILTLEITGVPHHCVNRVFPWPAPVFTAPIASRTRSHDSTFEVTMFDSGQTDFVIPEVLYILRIKGLEEAIQQNGGIVSNLSITINFPPDSGERGYCSEDPNYISHHANLVAYAGSNDDDYHFQGSGYNALTVKWDEADKKTIPVCAWDAHVIGLSSPNVPQMSPTIKNAVNAALKQVMNCDPKVKEWYENMPDCCIYSDYLLMVEIPMYLQLILRRMQSNYYTNKLSVVADMELIKENCYKYNKDNNEFYDLACEMHNKFEELINAIPVDPCSNESNEIPPSHVFDEIHD